MVPPPAVSRVRKPEQVDAQTNTLPRHPLLPASCIPKGKVNNSNNNIMINKIKPKMQANKNHLAVQLRHGFALHHASHLRLARL